MLLNAAMSIAPKLDLICFPFLPHTHWVFSVAREDMKGKNNNWAVPYQSLQGDLAADVIIIHLFN